MTKDHIFYRVKIFQNLDGDFENFMKNFNSIFRLKMKAIFEVVKKDREKL